MDTKPCKRCGSTDRYAPRKDPKKFSRIGDCKPCSRAANCQRGTVYARKKSQSDPQFRLARRLRTRLYGSIKTKQKVGSAVSDLGCSVAELKLHLENQFQPGMTWDNWSYTGWHIDHITPLSSFDLTDREQFLKACHFTNLRPLWAKDNLAKSGKVLPL